MLALRGHADGVVPLSAFQALCEAIGTEGRIVRGNHSFLLADPVAFGEAMGKVLSLSATRRRRRSPAAVTTAHEIPLVQAGGATA